MANHSAWAVCKYRSVFVSIFATVFAASGFYLIMFIYMLYALTHNAHWSIHITTTMEIDVYGALIPVVIGFIFVILYLRYFKFSRKRFALSFILSIVLAFLIQQFIEIGVMAKPVLFAFVGGTAVVSLTYYQDPLSDAKRKYIAALLAASGCFPLSNLVVDLFYLPYYIGPTIIGGSGLIDGVFLSILLAPVCVTLIVSVPRMILEFIRLNRKLPHLNARAIYKGAIDCSEQLFQKPVNY